MYYISYGSYGLSAARLLAVPQGIVRGLPERLQELLGYNIYPPLVGYVDGPHPRRVLLSDH